MSVETELAELRGLVTNHLVSAGKSIEGLQTDVRWLKALALLILASMFTLFFAGLFLK